MKQLIEFFGSKTFNDKVMQQKLSKEAYKRVQEAIFEGRTLDLEVADIVANAMKNWALSLGATHFTHWFQPMTGITAEKHDSFISPVGDGTIIMEFSGKELIKGEPDASSFPSGGIRATFEARGYTAWDPSSYAFVKDNTLYIPTAFCSYTGEALDKKTPLLRSMQALDIQARRILRLFGDSSTKKVIPTVGAEQEYFLIDTDLYNKRKDLVYSNRTLFGAKPPKSQELDDHYFGTIKTRVAAFMADLNEELWSLGVLSKTEHNEAAPAQHELAPIFSSCNVATDQNQLTMELMKKTAAKHNLTCLLHEKPFAGINGSGKHNNWSLSTDKGYNLLDPGTTPWENTQFLLFLIAIIKGIDDYQDLLRMTVANAGNDHRLGANEAPPAIVSIFLGDELTRIIETAETGGEYIDTFERIMNIGAKVLPTLPKDTTDRNRTSPFAFTGNKFEFRMLGSSMSISGPNIALNTIIAESLSIFADILEKADDFNTELKKLIVDEIKAHKRIIFNGDGYTEAWVKEAEKRGLSNFRSAPEALPSYISGKNLALFQKHMVFSETEQNSRYEIKMEEYCKTLRIEALTMLEIISKDILPAAMKFKSQLLSSAAMTKSFMSEAPVVYESARIKEISELSTNLFENAGILAEQLKNINNLNTIEEKANTYREKVFFKMEELRRYADSLELIVSKELWPFPTYGDLLYSV